MRVAAIILTVIILMSAGAMAADPYAHKIAKLYEQATIHSKEIYNIPIEVRLLDLSEDLTWFKVSLQFYLGPVKFNYTGWTNIPIGPMLAQKRGTDGQIIAKNN